MKSLPDQAEIHKKCTSEKNGDRREALELLKTYFSNLPDKDQAWQDLIRLTQDQDYNVQGSAAEALGPAFNQVSDKDRAWQDLIRLTQDQDYYVRRSAAEALGPASNQVSDKDRAWQDLIRLTQDKDSYVRWGSAGALGSAFCQVHEKAQAWQDLIRLTQDQDYNVRRSVTDALGSAFCQVPDKDRAWKDLHRLAQDRDYEMRLRATESLKTVFSQVPDKAQVWQDLHRLTLDDYGLVRGKAAEVLGTAFNRIPDKDQAWQDLHRLTRDQDKYVRRRAAEALGPAFSQVCDKAQAWQDLIRLTQDKDSYVRWGSAGSLGSAFSQVYDKAKAWQDLIRLAQDEDRDMRVSAVESLRSAFSQVHDKAKAWQDLIGLTQHGDNLVRGKVAIAMGSVFSQVLDKDQAWQDLHSLTEDEDSTVRMYAYHSLGRVSVLKATDADDKAILRMELENAVAYFEKSTHEAHSFNPARFCHPFYRTYLAITFQEAKEDEVQRYLAEARRAVGRSESKDELLMAVENLAGALQESQRLKAKSNEEIASQLNTYRWYCEKAGEYMAVAEDKAPGTVKLMRRCNPLLEDKIQATIAEIQEKARQISPEVDRAARCLSLGDPIKVHQCCMRMASALRASCNRFPDEKRELTCGILSDIEKEEELFVVLGKIELAIAYTLPEIETERKEMLDRLKNIEFSMARLNLSSGSARQDLFELKTIIKNFQDKTEAHGLSMEELNKVLKERDDTLIERLQKMKEDWLLSVEEMAQSLPSSDENERILNEIQSLRQSRKRDALGITGDISSIVDYWLV